MKSSHDVLTNDPRLKAHVDPSLVDVNAQPAQLSDKRSKKRATQAEKDQEEKQLRIQAAHEVSHALRTCSHTCMLDNKLGRV